MSFRRMISTTLARIVAPLVMLGVVAVSGCTQPESDLKISHAPETKPPASSTTRPPRRTTTTQAVTEPVSIAPATTQPATTHPETTITTNPASTSSTVSVAPTSLPVTNPSAPTTTVPTPTTVGPGGNSPQVTPAGCLYTVAPGDSLTDLVARYNDDSITVEGLIAENHLASPVLNPGQLLDVCVGDSIDSVAALAPPPPPLEGDAALVAAQQTKLNELFAGLGISPLEVDGDSGAVTEQRLCAWRLTAGLPASRADMAFGSDEERLLMAMPKLTPPVSAATVPSRWALIDQHCQIMFVGEGPDHLTFVFPTSTGIGKYPTRLQNQSVAFKYDPASNNRGWHDSYDYPASDDNPLNGNMYRPVYFDRGQAIHGANNVPRKPASHGCARLRVADMDKLITWLGLDGQKSITKDKAQINLTVSIQGRY